MTQYSIRPKRSAVRAQAVYFLHSTMPSVTFLRLSDVSVICVHRSRIRYLSKKFANFNEFSEIKKIRKNSYKNSLNARVGVAFQWKMSRLAFSVPFSIISNKPTTTTEEFDAFHGFMLIKILKNVQRRFALYSDLLYE